MESKERILEFIFFKGEHRLLGVEIQEVNKVIPPLFKLDGDAREEITLKEQGNFYTLKSFFKDETDQVNSLVYITSVNREKEIILGVPGEIEIFKVSLADIMVLPGFLRKKQTPLFCWGAIQRAEKLVMLITFSRFITAFGHSTEQAAPARPHKQQYNGG